MLATRQGAMVLALVCAACAAGVMLFALSSYKTGVQKAVTPIQSTVLVATGEIQKGTSGNLIAADKLYKSMPVVASQLSAGAISDAALLQGKVAQADVLPGQQLTTTDFTATVGVTGLLGPNQRAVSIPAAEVQSDLDVLVPGDRVDLYAELVKGGSPTTSATQISLLASDVLVLKTPGTAVLGTPPVVTTTKTTTAPAVGGTSLVLQVSSSFVPVLALTGDTGKIWVSLRPANAVNPPEGITTLQSILAQDGSASASASAGGASTSTTNTTGTHG
jgi:Flp pilus assembly protein CpaB